MPKQLLVPMLGSVIAVMTSLALTGPAQAARGRVEICHVDDEGGYHRINVSERAAVAHVAHGDGFVGDVVPGLEGFVFGESCSLDAVSVDPIPLDCYRSSTGFNDLRYVGPPDTAGNVISYGSTDGSCAGVVRRTGDAVVIAESVAEADGKCSALGLNSLSWAGPLNAGVLGYPGFPGNAWYCRAP